MCEDIFLGDARGERPIFEFLFSDAPLLLRI